jgi:hypothetical protein
VHELERICKEAAPGLVEVLSCHLTGLRKNKKSCQVSPCSEDPFSPEHSVSGKLTSKYALVYDINHQSALGQFIESLLSL